MTPYIFFLKKKPKKSQDITCSFLKITFLYCLWLRKEKKIKIQVVYKAHAHIKLPSFATKLGTWKLFVEGLFNCALFIFHVFSCSLTWRVECWRKMVLDLKSMALTFSHFIHFLKVIDCTFVPSELAGKTCLLWRKY